MIAALEKYKQAGFACLPTAKDKLPSIPKGESWLMGWNNKAEYEKSFGIGIICGNISGNLECIDFDNHFGDAKQVVSDLLQIEEVKAIYEKYKLPIQSTTSGGFHMLYRCSVISGNQKLASRPKYDNATKKYKKDVLIETRGEGGYFCADPTPGYKVIRNDLSKVPNITPEEREILHAGCISFNTYAEVKRREEENQDLPGNVFNHSIEAKTEMESALRSAGWHEVKEGYWLRPGKKKGISATIGKVASGVFYNFSSSADPFENNHAYSPFQVVALLSYGGNFSQFAKELAQRYNLKKESREPAYKKEESKKPEQIDEIIRRCFIDTDIPVAKPPVILKMKALKGNESVYTRVFTLGNFSAIIGKSKAKKSFLASMIEACAVRGGRFENTFEADLPSGRPMVVHFDTEQSNYDAYISAKRVSDLCGNDKNKFGLFDLREFTALERCNIIDRFIETKSHAVSLIVIDGIADLANAINDEIEASRVVSLLLKWTKLYNLHICVVIHQNKNDNFATGHLGSSIMKKAECVISVTKDVGDTRISEVRCDYIRGAMEFDKFNIIIDDEGIPKVDRITIINREEPTFYN
ncbi:MAG TPA: AAA family ATPase [Bacteroidales bacterium]|nr:AAA family ATPase [Bacteroidales bacterium]